jgi:RNA recognition motif-containing protein
MVTTVFVANLPFDWDEVAIKKYFANYVPILKIDVVKDPLTHKSHGAALLTLGSDDDAQKLIDKFNRQLAEKRMLSLKKAEGI